MRETKQVTKGTAKEIQVKTRLAYLREQIENECISYGEIAELLDIETTKSVVLDGVTFTNKSSQSDFIGELTIEQEDFLEDCLFNS